jgi:hypothetical protein
MDCRGIAANCGYFGGSSDARQNTDRRVVLITPKQLSYHGYFLMNGLTFCDCFTTTTTSRLYQPLVAFEKSVFVQQVQGWERIIPECWGVGAWLFRR